MKSIVYPFTLIALFFLSLYPMYEFSPPEKPMDFCNLLIKTQGGWYNANRNTFSICASTQDDFDLQGVLFAANLLGGGEVIAVRHYSQETFVKFPHNKKIICFGLSPDGSKLIISYNKESQNGFCPMVELYNVQANTDPYLLCDPINIRERLSYPVDTLDGVAVSPDGKKFAFIYQVKNDAMLIPQTKYRITLINLLQGTLCGCDLFPIADDFTTYTFISFLFSEDNTKLGIYYQEEERIIDFNNVSNENKIKIKSSYKIKSLDVN